MGVQSYLTHATLHDAVLSSGYTSRSEGIRFRGAVRNHPHDPMRFLLITNPMESHSRFYEFRVSDIVRVRDVRQIVTETCETVQIVEMVLRKGCVAIEMRPFVV